MRYPPSPSPPLSPRHAIYVAGIPVQTDWGPSSTYHWSGVIFILPVAFLGQPWTPRPCLQRSCEADVCGELYLALEGASHATAI